MDARQEKMLALDPRQEKMLDFALRNLFDFGTRAMNVFTWHQIDTLRDLLQYTPQRLLKFRNFGKKSLQRVQEELHREGFGLAVAEPAKDAEEVRARFYTALRFVRYWRFVAETNNIDISDLENN
jgi:DNA-directed RNA polymerase alpha subunit